MESSPIPKGRILCTEDDCDTQEMLILMLQNCGYEVVCTASPAQGLALGREQQFDLFLFDNWMPEFDGVELAREIRKFNQTTPILSSTQVQRRIQTGKGLSMRGLTGIWSSL
jgi:DNA-binding response OmpR family regulator